MASPTTPNSFSPIRPDSPGELGFPPSLPVELAMGLNPVKAICAEYDLTRDELAQLIENPIFQAEYNAAMKTRGKEGGLFTLKARLMADDALEVQYKIMKDSMAPVATRLKASENLIEASGLMPKKDAGVAPGAGFSISIDLSGRSPAAQPQTQPHTRPMTITIPAAPAPSDNVYDIDPDE